MDSTASFRRAYFLSKERLVLTLALPYALLYGASLSAWPWRILGWPGVVGSLTPPSILLLALAVAAAAYAIGRKLPMGMLTWVPAGAGALVLLGVGLLPPDMGEAVALLATMIVTGVMFFLTLGIAIAVAKHGVRLSISIMALFVMAQAARFPIFEVNAVSPIAHASLFTAAAALRSAIELAALVWLASRLVTAPPEAGRRYALIIVWLTLVHGVIAGWEDPILQGNLSLAQVMEEFTRWFLPAAAQIGIVAVLARFRNSTVPQGESGFSEVSATGDTGSGAGAAMAQTRVTPRSSRRRRSRRNSLRPS